MKTRHQGTDGGSLPGGIHNKQQGDLQQAGHMGGAALLAGTETVIQAHDPLHQTGVRGVPPMAGTQPVAMVPHRGGGPGCGRGGR